MYLPLFICPADPTARPEERDRRNTSYAANALAFAPGASLAAAFPDSRLRLDGIGGMFGEAAFGPVSQAVTAGLEAGLFASLVVAGMVLASRVIDRKAG